MDARTTLVWVSLNIGVLLWAIAYHLMTREEKKHEASLPPVYVPRFRKIIVAGNYAQATIFAREKGWSPYEYTIAFSAEAIRGLRFRNSDVYYTGTYYDRKDLQELYDYIEHVTAIHKES